VAVRSLTRSILSRQVEEEVDTRWVQYLRDSCYAQMQEKKNLVNKYARQSPTPFRRKRYWPVNVELINLFILM
jgi:hypothetical protein